MLVRQRWLGAAALALAVMPLLFYWDNAFWPDDETAERKAAERLALAQWRAVAGSLGGGEPGPILAPWWLSPATAYWSGLPVVAGSSHESLPGIVASARFFLSPSPEEAAAILRQHRVKWVLSDEAVRVAPNSAAILGTAVPVNALCLRLEGGGAPIPAFLSFIGRHGSCVLYRVVDPPRK